MAEMLKGAPVAAAINEKTKEQVKTLKERGIIPNLTIVQVGNNEADNAYCGNAVKKCTALGIDAEIVKFNDDITQDELLSCIARLNEDQNVHGVLIMSNLPPHIHDDAVRRSLKAEKDIDGISDISLGGVVTGKNTGYAPCTAEACMKILEHYNVALDGKKVCVIGRSRVVGKPAALMALSKNATVTVCHSRTENIEAVAKASDIIIAAVGKAGMINGEYMSAGQTIIDVGINVNSEGRLCGDVNAEDAEAIVGAYTPVPGGVGAVTTAVLLSHVVNAAGESAGLN